MPSVLLTLFSALVSRPSSISQSTGASYQVDAVDESTSSARLRWRI